MGYILKKKLPDFFKIKVNKRQYEILLKNLPASNRSNSIGDTLTSKQMVLISKYSILSYREILGIHPFPRIRFKDYFIKEKKQVTFDQMIELISETSKLVQALRDLYRDKHPLPKMENGSVETFRERYPEPGDVPVLSKDVVNKMVAESKNDIHHAHRTKKA